MDAEYGVTLHASHDLWPWVARWCSIVRSRFAVKASQRTAHQDAFDSKAQQSKMEDKEGSGEYHEVKRSAEEIGKDAPNQNACYQQATQET